MLLHVDLCCSYMLHHAATICDSLWPTPLTWILLFYPWRNAVLSLSVICHGTHSNPKQTLLCRIMAWWPKPGDQLDQVGKMKRKGPTQPSLTPKIKIWGHHRCITVASPLHHRCSTWQRPHDQDLFARRSWGVWRAGWGRRSSRRDHERSRTAGFDRGAIPKGVVNLFCRRIHISNKLYGFQNRWMWRINPTCYHQKGADSHGRIFDPLSTHCLLAVPGRCDSHWKIPPVRELSAKGKTERLNKKKMVCDWFAAACSCLWHDVPHDAMRWHVMTCNHIKDG